jgi:hypothetical protein
MHDDTTHADLPEWNDLSSTIELLGFEESFVWGDPDESLLQVRSFVCAHAHEYIYLHAVCVRAFVRVRIIAHTHTYTHSQVWLLLLARAAGDSSVSDDALLQMIKDATDHVEDMHFDLSEIVENEKLLETLKSLVPLSALSLFLNTYTLVSGGHNRSFF